MQHGPLQNFHLYLNHGIALCKYQSREEANKAQQALNNCVLGNTTICAESPTDSEVQTILQHLGVPGGNNTNNNNNNNNVGNMGSTGGGLGGNNNSQPWRTGGSQQSNVRSTGMYNICEIVDLAKNCLIIIHRSIPQILGALDGHPPDQLSTHGLWMVLPSEALHPT